VATFLIEPLGGQNAFASAPTQPPAPENLDQVLVSSLQAPAWTREVHQWTAAEMANAQPYPIPVSEGSPDLLVPLSDSVQPLAGGGLQTSPAALAEGEVGFVNELDRLGNFGAAAPTGYGYPGPYTRYTYFGKYSKEFPYKTVGKLFFVQNGYQYVCSGAVIGPRAIWTAGHCVHDGSGSSSGWSYYTMFIPAYDRGKKPLGAWYGVELWTSTEWYDPSHRFANGGNLAYDYGGMIMAVSKRKTIGQRTGWLGFAYTQTGYNTHFHWFGVGYPHAAPFDGLKQVVCASSYAYSDTNFSPAPVGVGCDQTGGTSGGPWIWGFGSVFWLNGNMSYRYVNPNHPEEMFSPFFDSNAYALWYELFY
jgi:V8-like Glu-specific endopeptidase